MPQLPSFIAFTGIDSLETINGLQALSARYPIEWGILIDDAQTHNPLFPDAAKRQTLLKAGGLRLAAHVCGDEARKIANAPMTVTTDLTGFQRVQVNHSFSGSSAEQIENTVRFGRQKGLRMMLQCKESFPADTRLDWLFDVSFGKGMTPKSWPKMPVSGPFCGYSGGIGPDHAAAVVKSINAPQGEQFWIDMESGIRTDNRLDLGKCEAVCKAVFG